MKHVKVTLRDLLYARVCVCVRVSALLLSCEQSKAQDSMWNKLDDGTDESFAELLARLEALEHAVSRKAVAALNLPCITSNPC